jgi:hypothetical protein
MWSSDTDTLVLPPLCQSKIFQHLQRNRQASRKRWLIGYSNLAKAALHVLPALALVGGCPGGIGPRLLQVQLIRVLHLELELLDR